MYARPSRLQPSASTHLAPSCPGQMHSLSPVPGPHLMLLGPVCLPHFCFAQSSCCRQLWITFVALVSPATTPKGAKATPQGARLGLFLVPCCLLWCSTGLLPWEGKAVAPGVSWGPGSPWGSGGTVPRVSHWAWDLVCCLVVGAPGCPRARSLQDPARGLLGCLCGCSLRSQGRRVGKTGHM